MVGLSSTEVEALITVPIEADLLNGVPWLETIQSESISGLSSIEMTFAPGTDYMRARQMVQERLSQAHALPNVSRPPTLLQRSVQRKINEPWSRPESFSIMRTRSECPDVKSRT